MRQSAAARFLSESGLECAVWGMDPGADIGGCVRCDDWRSAVNGAAVVVLPLPASYDGVRVNCPMSPESRLRLSTLLDAVNVPVLGGRLPDFLVRSAEEKELKIYDYYDSEELKIKNALPTAEGAVSIAMREMERTVNGCHAIWQGRRHDRRTFTFDGCGCDRCGTPQKRSCACGNMRYEAASYRSRKNDVRHGKPCAWV